MEVNKIDLGYLFLYKQAVSIRTSAEIPPPPANSDLHAQQMPSGPFFRDPLLQVLLRPAMRYATKLAMPSVALPNPIKTWPKSLSSQSDPCPL